MICTAYVRFKCSERVVEVERPSDMNHDSYTAAQLSDLQSAIIYTIERQRHPYLVIQLIRQPEARSGDVRLDVHELRTAQQPRVKALVAEPVGVALLDSTSPMRR